MLLRTRVESKRHITHFVSLSSRKLVLGVVGVTPGKLQGPDSGQEALDLYKHFVKNQIPISHVCLGVFDDDAKDLISRVDRKLQKVDSVDNLPSGGHRHLLQLVQQAAIDRIPVAAVARHPSHTFVRTSWTLWDFRDERHKLLREILCLRKLFTAHAFKFFDQIAPHFAHIFYYEPARFMVLKTLKTVEAQVCDGRVAVILAVPETFVHPVLRVLQDERIDKVSAEELSVMQAAGYSYWSLLFLGYVAVPLLIVSLVVNFANKKLRQIWSAEHLQTEGNFGSRWIRDTRRD